jgi:hypothetical protein
MEASRRLVGVVPIVPMGGVHISPYMHKNICIKKWKYVSFIRSSHIKLREQSICAFLRSNSPMTKVEKNCRAIVPPKITCRTPHGIP